MMTITIHSTKAERRSRSVNIEFENRAFREEFAPVRFYCPLNINLIILLYESSWYTGNYNTKHKAVVKHYINTQQMNTRPDTEDIFSTADR